MDFFSFAFFIKVCELGLDLACQEFSLTRSDGYNVLLSLERFWGTNLFINTRSPSKDNLNSIGLQFFESAKNLVDGLLSNILEKINAADSHTTLNVKSDMVNGKDFILPVINNIENHKKDQRFSIKLFTFNNHHDKANSNMHVIFDRLAGSSNLFFEKLWSVKITQGLYTTEKYLHESGGTPSCPKDLLNHSILGIGDSFDSEIYTRTNWHLSGKYLGIPLNPSIMINSQSVAPAAIKADLGIGPMMHYQTKLTKTNVIKVLPEIDGPPVIIDFAVRKNISPLYQDSVRELESRLLAKFKRLNLKIIYGE